MTTTHVIIGVVIGLIVFRQVRESFVKHLHATPSKGQDLKLVASAALSATPLGAASGLLDEAHGEHHSKRGWAAKTGWVVSLGARLAFILWLYDITDGAAFSPFGFMGDAFGGSMWQPALLALGLTEVVGRVGAIVFRAATRADRENGPAVAEPIRTI